MEHPLNQLASAWRSQGRRVYGVPAGVGVEFDDGNDAWWVLPGEPSSSVMLPAGGLSDADVARLAALFDVVNGRRRQVVHVLRHYLASQRFYVDRNRSGHWGVMKESGVSSELHVGAWLTRRCAEEGDVVILVRELLEHGIVRRPSPRRVARHLGAAGDPPGERPYPEEPPTITIPNTIVVALGWMGLCRALKHDESFTSVEAFVRAAEPRGKIGQAMLRLAQRLPEARANVEMTTGALEIDFSDGLADFPVNPKGRELATLIRDVGPEAAGDRLADEFLALDRDRGRFLGALYAALAARGHRLDEHKSGLYFGPRHREVHIDPGEPLTKAVREHGVAGAARLLLAGHGDVAEEVVARAQGPDVPRPKEVRIEKAELPPAPPPQRMHLPEPTAEEIQRIDARCREILDAYLTDEAALRDYFDPDRYDPARDAWASPEAWRELARRFLNDRGWPRPDARLILIEQGDRSPEGEFIGRLRQGEPHHEVSPAEVIGVWCYRHEHPEMARRWLAPERYQDLQYEELRCRLGDPPAVRATVMRLLDVADESAGPDESAEPVWEWLQRLDPRTVRWFADEATVNRWHAAALKWAREAWRWDYGGDPEVMVAAAAMGWADVAETLEANPYLPDGLLRAEGPGGQPGTTVTDKLLLAWSRLRPSPWLRRLVAHAFRLDPVALAERSAREIVDGLKGSAFRGEDFLRSVTTTRVNQTLRPLAITWTRCRATT